MEGQRRISVEQRFTPRCFVTPYWITQSNICLWGSDNRKASFEIYTQRKKYGKK